MMKKYRIKELVISILMVVIASLLLQKQSLKSEFNKNVDDYNKIVKEINHRTKLLDSVVEDNRMWHNHAVRMQLIAGVKNPDTIFTWKEKVIHPINTKRTIKYKVKK